MVIRYKIVSTSFLGPFQSSKSITELLDLSLREIDARVNQALEIDKESLETFVRIRTLIGEALLRTDESSRSRTSSLSSAASLGSRIADYDKEFLYTYRWGLSRWTNHQESKADFQKWLEGGYKLPPKGAILNCWEATIVNLYLYNAFDKNALVSAFVEGKKSIGSDGKAQCIESDADIISCFLGFMRPTHKVNRIEDIQPGDIISFTSVNGTENAHVAVTFEVVDSVKLGSFWTIPQEKMILISPNKLLAVSSEAAERSNHFEELDIDQIKISKKFRSFFQSLVD